MGSLSLPRDTGSHKYWAKSHGRAVYRVKDALEQIVSQVTEEVERFDHCFRILLLQRDEWIVGLDRDALRPGAIGD